MYSVPEPSSGTILGYLLSLLDGFLPVKLPKSGRQTSNYSAQPVPDLNDTFVITEAFKYAYALRSSLGDPHFHNISEVCVQFRLNFYCV